jgi:NADPH:quinone reductase-like Zn-dependent oxidoreductase
MRAVLVEEFMPFDQLELKDVPSPTPGLKQVTR